MLYHAYELSHAIFSPARKVAKLVKQANRAKINPLSHTFVGKRLSAGLSLFERVTKRYDKPEWKLPETRYLGKTVSVTGHVVWEKPFARLVHFRRDIKLADKRRSTSGQPRVLIVAPLSGHYATLLRGTVEAFLPDHEVFVTEWTDARDVPVTAGKFDLNDYIDYLIEMLLALGPGVHIVAVCQPGPAVLAAVSVMSENRSTSLPATMTIMGSPIDTRLSPTVPNELARKNSYKWFKKNMIYSVPLPHKGVLRKVYPGFLQLGGFITMNSDRHIQAHKDYFNHLVEGDRDSTAKHKEFYDEYLAVLDLPAEFYLQTIKDVFQEHKLPDGKFYHRGKLVKPELITEVGLMTVEGENDDISGIGQTQAAHTLCCNIPQSRQQDYIQPGVGHYGVFSGRRFREEIQPRVAGFILDNFDAKKEKALQKERRYLFELAEGE
ncbi:MAG: polyhydroxyalkanoate depolymerase [Gammaproteobacteria bacterium]|nr:MAG: polyhydroxyalkanoate depolymerase [Pseudomonadota bacterium]PIE38551.1 MAG: polyhydroxyalkanoate depolymerase [Gammaproteobacteria bacterium]